MQLLTFLLTVIVALLSTSSSAQDTSSSEQIAQSKTKPCTSAPYRHFDFWLGRWKVLDESGKHVGDSNIQSIMNGCAISEQWTSVSGYRGVSYNFYDRSKQQWHQTWIGVDGNPLYLDGKLITDNSVSKKMVLQGQTKAKDGKILKQKITWTLLIDGRVSQHWQVSKDQGKTWSDSFFGFYSPKPIISLQVQ